MVDLPPIEAVAPWVYAALENAGIRLAPDVNLPNLSQSRVPVCASSTTAAVKRKLSTVQAPESYLAKRRLMPSASGSSSAVCLPPPIGVRTVELPTYCAPIPTVGTCPQVATSCGAAMDYSAGSKPFENPQAQRSVTRAMAQSTALTGDGDNAPCRSDWRKLGYLPVSPSSPVETQNTFTTINKLPLF